MLKHFLITVLLCIPLCSNSCHAQLFPRLTKAKPVCYLSGHYDWNADLPAGNRETEISFRGIEQNFGGGVSSTGIPYPSKRSRRFQLSASEIRSDHCRISEVAMLITEDGDWSIDFVANQQPAIVDPKDQARVLVFTRNQFVLTVRPLVTAFESRADQGGKLAAPSATVINRSFWLAKNSSRRFHLSGKMDPKLQAYFDSVHYVSFDLEYR